jgi:hypothetical protein
MGRMRLPDMVNTEYTMLLLEKRAEKMGEVCRRDGARAAAHET